MASSLKFFACLFIISLLSSQIHARESQFFSKVSSTTTATPTTTGVNKDEVLNKNSEQDPSFIPETQNAYGLYGQESSQYPPTTTQLAGTDPYTTTPTTNIPYKTQETYTGNNNDAKYYYNNNNNEFSNNNNEFNNVNAYDYQQENTPFGETRLQDTGYTTTPTSEYQNNNNNNDNYYYNGGNGYSNVEKQGMSDTRFMENGKYYYDPNNPNNPNNGQNNNYYTNDEHQKVNYENNNESNFYSSNNNEYNSMERPQNVENFQNEQYDP